MLQTRALLAISIPMQPVLQEPLFRWLSTEPDVTSAEYTWYTDGSVVHPHSQECIAAACAIAICDRSGALVGLAEARLPSRVTTAAEAEAWGIFFAVFLCPFPPHIVTDCLSLLRTAECGTASATAATRRLGGIWARIAASLDGNLASLVEGERLVWMPAHQTSADTARRVKSNGQRLARQLSVVLGTPPMRLGWRRQRWAPSPERPTITALMWLRRMARP
jgi:hypothetical protein